MTSAPPLPIVTAVRAEHRFDEARLEGYLAAALPEVAPPLALWQFEGGQSNPTFLVEDARGRRLVLRKKPPGALLPSAHQVEREFKVMRALAATDVPVPACHLLCEDPSIVGTAFFVMDYIEGRILRDPALPGLEPAARAATYDAMNEAFARLHRVDPLAIGLGDFGKPAGYLARQVARWKKQYDASTAAGPRPIEAMEWLTAWLTAHLPAEGAPAIAHGDLRLDNLVFHPSEPRVLAVIDWELATLGDPIADFAYGCLAYHLPSLGKGLGGLVGRDLAALGIPSEAAFVEAWCRRTGRAGIPDLPYYLAFGLFRLAAIAQGVYARALAGSASSSSALDVGMMAALLAERARAIAEGRE